MCSENASRSVQNSRPPLGWPHIKSSRLIKMNMTGLSRRPPRTDADVCSFISIFTNAGTAANYVGYVKWACANFNFILCLVDRLSHVDPQRVQPALAKVLLTDDWLLRLHAWQTAKVSCMFRRVLLCFWYFSCVFKAKI